MLTSPITTPSFQSRVLALLSSHLAAQYTLEDNDSPPPPIIPPFMAVDTPLTPADTVSQLIGYSSPWIDLTSSDPLIANLSRQVLNMEVAYAAFCGISNIIIPGPRTHNNTSNVADGLAQYARAVQEALGIGSYMNVAIHLPMYDTGVAADAPMGDLASFAREEYFNDSENDSDLFAIWDSWNVIRSVCKYSSRLSIGESSILSMKPCLLFLCSSLFWLLCIHRDPSEHHPLL